MFKKEKHVEVEVATTIQKKKSSPSSYCSMKKTNNFSKYHTGKNKKKERIMKSSTKNNNDASLNPTTQRNQETDIFFLIKSIKSRITSEHPLVKLGYIIFGISDGLQKI